MTKKKIKLSNTDLTQEPEMKYSGIRVTKIPTLRVKGLRNLARFWFARSGKKKEYLAG